MRAASAKPSARTGPSSEATNAAARQAAQIAPTAIGSRPSRAPRRADRPSVTAETTPMRLDDRSNQGPTRPIARLGTPAMASPTTGRSPRVQATLTATIVGRACHDDWQAATNVRWAGAAGAVTDTLTV